MSEKMKKFLIVLSGGGDTVAKLCSPETEGWLHMNPKFEGGHSAEEKIPADVQAGADPNHALEETVRVTSGSWENDRALAAPGLSFETLSGALEWVIKNEAELTGEYHGCIY
jgi:hypothetical protein